MPLEAFPGTGARHADECCWPGGAAAGAAAADRPQPLVKHLAGVVCYQDLLLWRQGVFVGSAGRAASCCFRAPTVVAGAAGSLPLIKGALMPPRLSSMPELPAQATLICRPLRPRGVQAGRAGHRQQALGRPSAALVPGSASGKGGSQQQQDRPSGQHPPADARLPRRASEGRPPPSERAPQARWPAAGAPSAAAAAAPAAGRGRRRRRRGGRRAARRWRGRGRSGGTCSSLQQQALACLLAWFLSTLLGQHAVAWHTSRSPQ